VKGTSECREVSDSVGVNRGAIIISLPLHSIQSVRDLWWCYSLSEIQIWKILGLNSFMLENILQCLANVLMRKNGTFHNLLIVWVAVSFSKTASEMFFFNFQMRFMCGVWEIHIYVSVQHQNYFGVSVPLRYDTASLGNWFTIFQRNIVALSSGV